VKILDLMFQPTDFLDVTKPTAHSPAISFASKQGVGTRQGGFLLSFSFDLEELSRDRTAAHFFDEGHMGEDFLAHLSKFVRFEGRGNHFYPPLL
jgi:hypothetical protein